MSPIQSVLSAFQGTPVWVWVVLCYLLIIGILAMHKRVVYVPRLLITPVLIFGLLYRLNLSDTSVVLTFISLICGCIVGYFLTQRIPIKVINHRSIEIAGTYTTFITLMLFFCIKYAFGYLKATHPDLAYSYIFFEAPVTVLFSGYFLGVASSYLYRWYIGRNR